MRTWTCATPAGSQQKSIDDGEAFISRLTSGMAFDFSARDERVYIVGTEDGWVHRCSTSYNEQVGGGSCPSALWVHSLAPVDRCFMHML